MSLATNISIHETGKQKEKGEAMKLIGELKEKVEKTETREEAKKIIEEAGMELTQDELDQVAGGISKVFDNNGLYQGHQWY